MAHNQVQNFTDYLANAFLIHKVSRYDVEGKRILETGETYLFEDPVFRRWLLAVGL